MAFINFQPKDYFNTKLYTGTGSSNAQTGVGFQPDWLWIKDRDSGSNSHVITDAIRGTNKIIFSDSTSAELTDATRVTSFDSDGFTVGTSGSTNTNTNDYVAWNWKANGAGVSNTDGDITSTVSASSTSGFSIVKYTGNGSSGATVGHGLGSAPKMIILKELNNATDWFVYHNGIGATKYLSLNDADAAVTTAAAWNDTAPSSSVFTLGNGTDLNGSSDNYIAYCFAEKKGFSKFGSYTGNGNADGTFVYTGFRPAFIMVKRTNTTEGWYMYDVKRDTFNVSDAYLTANTSNAEATLTNGLDILSNGFKMRNTDTGHNASGSTYIYMAFSDQSIVSSNGVPAVAR